MTAQANIQDTSNRPDPTFVAIDRILALRDQVFGVILSSILSGASTRAVAVWLPAASPERVLDWCASSPSPTLAGLAAHPEQAQAFMTEAQAFALNAILGTLDPDRAEPVLGQLVLDDYPFGLDRLGDVVWIVPGVERQVELWIADRLGDDLVDFEDEAIDAPLPHAQLHAELRDTLANLGLDARLERPDDGPGHVEAHVGGRIWRAYYEDAANATLSYETPERTCERVEWTMSLTRAFVAAINLRPPVEDNNR